MQSVKGSIRVIVSMKAMILIRFNTKRNKYDNYCSAFVSVGPFLSRLTGAASVLKLWP